MVFGLTLHRSTQI